MATIEIECRACASRDIYRHGKASSGEQRYRCKECGHCFQMDYLYNGNQPGIADRIVDMAMNGSGVRDTSRVLGISQNTVIACLKNSTHRWSRHCPLTK